MEHRSIKPYIDGGSSIHSATAKAVVDKINNQIAERSRQLGRRNISIEVRTYGRVPTVHGFLVNDSHLYLGFTEFDQGKLHGDRGAPACKF